LDLVKNAINLIKISAVHSLDDILEFSLHADGERAIKVDYNDLISSRSNRNRLIRLSYYIAYLQFSVCYL
jgi:hypothetical protein